MLHVDLSNLTARTFYQPSFALQGTALTDLLPFRRIATAINGNPRDAKGEIYTNGDTEILVPEERRYDNLTGRLTSYTAHLDQARKITSRPNGTRQIAEMSFDENISPAEMTFLAKAVEEEHPGFPGYMTQIIHARL